jgi:hypothetical protein
LFLLIVKTYLFLIRDAEKGRVGAGLKLADICGRTELPCRLAILEDLILFCIRSLEKFSIFSSKRMKLK